MKLIVAVDENGGIGNKGKIPWSCVEDQLFFRFLTMGECVFMGRETYNSLPKSLSGRRNFVITSSDEPLDREIVNFLFKRNLDFSYAINFEEISRLTQDNGRRWIHNNYKS